MRYMNGVKSGMAQAKHRPMPVHNSQTFERKVGGKRDSAVVCYGSNDDAKRDHRNDALCVIKDNVQAVTQYGTTDVRNANNRDYYTSTPAIDINLLLRRATNRHMTLVAYCNMIGIATD